MSEPNVDRDRWATAQEYEADYWTGRATDISEGTSSELRWYRWRSEQLMATLKSANLLSILPHEPSILEIGSGPVGIVSFTSGHPRIAVDPLTNHFTAQEELVRARDPDVQYIVGVGESVPLASEQFDLIIADNCIDHVRDITSVMAEIRRLLTSTGLLYMAVNCRTSFGYYIHRLLARSSIDPGHPHTFTPRRLERLLDQHDFYIHHLKRDSIGTAFWGDLSSGQPRAILKALLGVSEFAARAIATKRENVAVAGE